MAWELNAPHEHKFQPEKYLSDDLRENFCRNPGKTQSSVWCFTTDPKKRWDYCGEVEEKTPEGLWGPKGKEYRGKQTKTRSGKECQAWAQQSPHKHEDTPEVHPTAGLVSNLCRNPNGEKTIWCYTTDSKTRWEFCDPVIEGAIKKVPVKAPSSEPEPTQEDLTGKDKEAAYRGSQIKTIGGEVCMEWADNEPHQHTFKAE